MSDVFMRSKLFVPGARPELFDKALASAADAVSFDLEDAVADERKAQARALVAAALQAAFARERRPLLIVRVNGLRTPLFEADLQAVVQPGLAMVNLPKAESASDVQHAAGLLERAEAARQLPQPIGLLVNIETPAALLRAAEIAAAHPRVVGLQLGLADLFEPLNIARDDRANVHAAMFALRMAAGAAGVAAWDGAHAQLADAAGFRAEAQMAQALGFAGKSCIHPSQIGIANEVFRAGSEAVAAAQRVLDAARQNGGRGVFVIDGKMIDAPFLRHAQAVVAAAQGGPAGPASGPQ